MEMERALSALEEVRLRLVHAQRFRGYSGQAAILSGAVAVAAGLYQSLEAAHPRSLGEVSHYLWMWTSCLVVALFLNYGALVLWYFRRPERRERRLAHSAALGMIPTVGLGGVLSWVLLERGLPELLPGVWYSCYGTGLLTTRSLMPRGAFLVALAFSLGGCGLLALPDRTLALSWWVMPAGFGFGQMWIGHLLLSEEDREADQEEGR